jgi:hypothetical protein
LVRKSSVPLFHHKGRGCQPFLSLLHPFEAMFKVET